MSDEDTVKTTVQMPRHLRDAAKEQTDHGELSERVRSLFREIAFGEDVSRREGRKLELERIRDKKSELMEQKRATSRRIAELAEKESRLEDELDMIEPESGNHD